MGRDTAVSGPNRPGSTPPKSRRSRAGALAVRAALSGALKWGGTEERGRFSINQLLAELLGRDSNRAGNVDELQLATGSEQGPLVNSRREVAFV